MNKIYLVLAVLIAGFLLAGDAFGLEEWDSKKARSLGISLLPVGTVILCESEDSVGFNWEKGEYVFARFKKTKRIFRKTEPKEGCTFVGGPWVEEGYVSEEDGYAYRNICIKHHFFGEEPKNNGAECNETYSRRDSRVWEPVIICRAKIYVPDVNFSANGLYHLSQIHGEVTSKPTGDRKSSQYIEWGRCGTISP
ncbi:MAG: hypothetical protein ISR86_12350 [Nitrospinaceae bacterium]|nr:hypothetical protein [Nitrospinaceae bacterium]